MLQRVVTAMAFSLLLAFAGTAAADNYPREIAAEVALYPGAQVMQQTSDKDGVQVVLSAPGTVEKAMAYYKQQMEKKGWKQENFQQMGPAQATGFVKGKRHAAITVMQVPGQLTVTIGIDR